MKILLIYLYVILITTNLHAFGWIQTDNEPLDKIVQQYSSSPYIDTEQVDLCSVQFLIPSKVVMNNSLYEACDITRNYGHIIKTDKYRVSCDELITQVRRCSKYFHQ